MSTSAPPLSDLEKERRILSRVRWAGVGLMAVGGSLYIYVKEAAQSAYLEFQRELTAWMAEQQQSSGAGEAGTPVPSFQLHDTSYQINPLWIWICGSLVIAGLLAMCRPKFVRRVVIG